VAWVGFEPMLLHCNEHSTATAMEAVGRIALCQLYICIIWNVTYVFFSIRKDIPIHFSLSVQWLMWYVLIQKGNFAVIFALSAECAYCEFILTFSKHSIMHWTMNIQSRVCKVLLLCRFYCSLLSMQWCLYCYLFVDTMLILQCSYWLNDKLKNCKIAIGSPAKSNCISCFESSVWYSQHL